jgi:hypothetical protein
VRDGDNVTISRLAGGAWKWFTVTVGGGNLGGQLNAFLQNGIFSVEGGKSEQALGMQYAAGV